MDTLNAISFPFSVDTTADRIREERDYDAYIVQLIKQVLLTNLGERINRPDFGSQIRSMVFGLNNPAAASYGRTLVYQALTTWLSDFIRPDNVDVQSIEEKLIVIVEYTVIAKGEKRFLNVELSV
jgi:phage baseplate assembly protein W